MEVFPSMTSFYETVKEDAGIVMPKSSFIAVWNLYSIFITSA